MGRINWKNLSLSSKIILEVGLIAFFIFTMNLGFYFQINRAMQNLDSVYASNAEMTQLTIALEKVQDSVFQYLKVKSSESLMEYYKNESDYREKVEQLNDQNVNDPIKILEKNIRKMSESYLQCAAETVQAKRGRNVERYKAGYDEISQLYTYISSHIDELNNHFFKRNSETYASLRQMLQYLEGLNTVCMLMVVSCGLVFLIFSTKETFTPLKDMAETARLVGQGNFHVKMPDTDAEDELGTVTRAFNTMVESLGEYMTRIKASMEKEQQMMERELLMENHLKEAQLKYLQSQINPHFLFNSLNAGAQLAMMEDAEKTGIFVEKMADFFRYNVKKGEEDASLQEELEAVNNYIYILNVRFAGDIHFTCESDPELEHIRIPSMILQPVVENAVNHGIRDIEWTGYIHLSVEKEQNNIVIRISDNGKGMTETQIENVFAGKTKAREEEGDSTGIGLNNVISRLELYYEQENLLDIYSAGLGKGTEVMITIPGEGGKHV